MAIVPYFFDGMATPMPEINRPTLTSHPGHHVSCTRRSIHPPDWWYSLLNIELPAEPWMTLQTTNTATPAAMIAMPLTIEPFDLVCSRCDGAGVGDAGGKGPGTEDPGNDGPANGSEPETEAGGIAAGNAGAGGDCAGGSGKYGPGGPNTGGRAGTDAAAFRLAASGLGRIVVRSGRSSGTLSPHWGHATASGGRPAPQDPQAADEAVGSGAGRGAAAAIGVPHLGHDGPTAKV